LAAVVAYANSHGVRVMPELDTPGHAFAWGQHAKLKAGGMLECDGPEWQVYARIPEAKS